MDDNATKNEDRNFLYLRSLKLKNPSKVDKIAKKLHEEAFNKIDCLKCGNCCKTSKPVLLDEDISRIAEFLKLPIEEIENKYLELDDDKDWTFNSLPCPFLANDNSCKIYTVRPKDCQEFPHTNKKGFSHRSYQHSWNTVVCPATYYIVTEMEKVMR